MRKTVFKLSDNMRFRPITPFNIWMERKKKNIYATSVNRTAKAKGAGPISVLLFTVRLFNRVSCPLTDVVRQTAAPYNRR